MLSQQKCFFKCEKQISLRNIYSLTTVRDMAIYNKNIIKYENHQIP